MGYNFCQVYIRNNKYYGYEKDFSWYIWDDYYDEWSEIFMDSFENLKKLDEYEDDYLRVPNYNICKGCQRLEIHKTCPAYGTPWYMSGVEFTKEIEEYIKGLKNV